VKPRCDTDRGSGSKTLNIENCVINIPIARLSPHYDELSLEGGFIEIDLDTGNEQPPDTRIAAAIFVDLHSVLNFLSLLSHCLPVTAHYMLLYVYLKSI
jgi:hypothetical protein